MSTRKDATKLAGRIIRLAKAGKTDQEIAHLLGLTVRSVQSRLYRIRKKGVTVTRPRTIFAYERMAGRHR